MEQPRNWELFFKERKERKEEKRRKKRREKGEKNWHNFAYREELKEAF